MKFEWEPIDLIQKGFGRENALVTRTKRAKVFGGWLVHYCNPNINELGMSMVFVPDPNHDWEGWDNE